MGLEKGNGDARTAPELRTERLWLRGWRPGDLEAFCRLNADPEVMRYFPRVLTEEESRAEAARIAAHFERHAFGVWAVEIPGVGEHAGFVGISVPAFEAHFTPCVEIGWRLAPEYWGRGFATEAARAVLEFGFGRLGLEEIVAFTVPANTRSRRVMEKLGMRCRPEDDFDHPRIAEGSPMRRHVLYRISRGEWRGD
ncbi:MAG: GNAT family N-acetyltransferase [Terriglobales bacterium]